MFDLHCDRLGIRGKSIQGGDRKERRGLFELGGQAGILNLVPMENLSIACGVSMSYPLKNIFMYIILLTASPKTYSVLVNAHLSQTDQLD